ncbi:hypothetical protein [Cupriavidus sp. CuC1]|uniref:aspartate racemase/maleate isomerase family protein n=1 Tax=Cupriavidus sp. CuC1 TaxID=3373131 RepID=UPI0037D64A1F
MPALTIPDYDEALSRSGQRRPAPPARVRLAVIVPSVNTVVEPWFGRVLPDSAALHATRMLLADDVTSESLKRMDREEGLAAARRIASCRPHAVAYCCTASSIVQGPTYDKKLQMDLERITGCPSFTAVGAITEALHQLGVWRLSIASPYTEAIDQAEQRFFAELGFRVDGAAHLGIGDGFSLACPTPEEIYALGRRAWRPSSDALLISCLNMNSQNVVSLLEQQLGRPVITSTTATLWKLMRASGLDGSVEGYGALLACGAAR